MKAARNFTFGPEDGEGEVDRKRFMAGDELPAKVVKALEEEGLADTLVLERAAKKDPNKLSRQQLLMMAGISEDEIAAEAEGEEMSEEDLREAMGEFNTKSQLVEWAGEVLAIELDVDDTRDQLEDQIIEFYFGEDEEGEEEDED